MTETARAVRGSEILSALKRRIIRWEYPPGYRFTEEEICKEFGVTPGYLRVCLHRAKKALKRRFLQRFDEKQKPTAEEKDH